MHSFREDMSFNAVTTEPAQSPWEAIVKNGNGAKIAIALVVSVVCGGYAASLTSSWFDDDNNINVSAVVAPAMKKIVVASQSVKHGEELTRKNTKMIDWAADTLPPSAFKSTDMLFTEAGKRYALSDMEPNEPVLGSRITAPGKMASLSSQLTPGKTAVTIRVNDVLGVGGLIVPNDRVDILWTSRPKGRNKGKEPFAAVLIPGVRVLALDQTVKKDSSKKRVARTVTIEVDTLQAQKVALASQTGKLHLALRSYGTMEVQNASFQRVNLSSLGTNSFASGLKVVPVSAQEIKFDPRDITASISRKRSINVIITRGLVSENYDVITKSSL